jgi:hypothetical protein
MLRRAALIRNDVSEEGIAYHQSDRKQRAMNNVSCNSREVFPRNVLWLLVRANVVPTSPIFVTLMIGAIRSSETSILTRATRHKILEDDILQQL